MRLVNNNKEAVFYLGAGVLDVILLLIGSTLLIRGMLIASVVSMLFGITALTSAALILDVMEHEEEEEEEESCNEVL